MQIGFPQKPVKIKDHVKKLIIKIVLISMIIILLIYYC